MRTPPPSTLPVDEDGEYVPDLYVVAERGIFHSDVAWLGAIEIVIGTNDRGLALQIRTKSESPERSRALAIEARKATRGSRIRVLLNGATEDALTLGYDGVHWPEALIPSGPPSSSTGRGLEGGISASVHSPEAARRAESAGATFLVAGTIFDAGSKAAPGEGLEHLHAIAGATTLPVLAIGGITRDRVEACIEAGAHGIAVVSAVLQAPDIVAAVVDLREALDSARSKAGAY